MDGITFEYTTRNSPFQNGKVERAFATLWGRIRSCSKATDLDKTVRYKLWCECASYFTQMDIITSTNLRMPPHKCFHDYNLAYVNNLKDYGEMGVVTKGPKIVGKIQDKGIK